MSSANASWKISKEHGRNKKEQTFIGGLIQDYYRVDGKSLEERNPKWLQDDYVKFIRFGQWRINQTGEGILAFISNNGYLDNPTFRGMRESLLREFDTIYLLNLHGNSRKKERTPDGSPDDNVFDIQQGVAIGIFVKQRSSTSELATIFYADIWGQRTKKYTQLSTEDITTTAWQTVQPTSPWYLFVPQDQDVYTEYERGWKITEVFPINVLGFQTHRDTFAIDFDFDAIYQRIKTLRNVHMSDAEIQQTYGISDNRDWKLAMARAKILADNDWKEKLVTCLYRPFDWRFCYYSDVAMDYPRRELMTHVATQENICLLSSRQQSMVGYRHCWVADIPAESCVISTTSREGNQVFPLYLYPNGHEHPSLFEHENGRRPNLSAAFITDIEQRLGLSFIPNGTGDLSTTIGPEDIFHYIYAIFHSPTYRSRYAECLKIDFPRVPITSDIVRFKTLAAYGAQLVDLHLLRLPVSGGVGGAGGAALLNKPGQHGIGQHNVTSTPIDTITYNAQQQRVVIGAGMYFEGVEAETWAMQIGGYQPLQKWLKDRKGRTLSFDDALHYMRMVLALRETRRIMGEIDRG